MSMIKTELEKSILDRVKWIEEGAFADEDNFLLGYMLGVLEEKALRLSEVVSGYPTTRPQTEEDHKEAREIVSDTIQKITTKITTERHQ